MVKAKDRKSKFNLNDRLHKVAKTMGVLIFLLPIVITGITKFIPYAGFIYKGPELVANVETLKTSVLVLTGAFADNSEFVDSIIYNVEWKDHKYTGRLKRMKTGDIYVFLKDGEVGEQIFLAIYHRGTNQYHFIDFDGNYTKLSK